MTSEMKEQLSKIKRPIIYNDDGTISIKKDNVQKDKDKVQNQTPNDLFIL